MNEVVSFTATKKCLLMMRPASRTVEVVPLEHRAERRREDDLALLAREATPMPARVRGGMIRSHIAGFLRRDVLVRLLGVRKTDNPRPNDLRRLAASGPPPDSSFSSPAPIESWVANEARAHYISATDVEARAHVREKNRGPISLDWNQCVRARRGPSAAAQPLRRTCVAAAITLEVATAISVVA